MNTARRVSMKIKKLMITVLMIGIACLLFTSCTIVPIDPDAGERRDVISAGERAVDMDEYMATYLDSVIIPEIEERRVSFSQLLDAAQNSWNDAGELFGEKKGTIGAIYNFIVHDTGVVKEVNTESRNGFIIIELENYQTNYEIRISIGPVLRGTAIRDSIKFVDFNQFVNQMDFAELANTFNRLGNENVLENVNIENLLGQTIEFTGSFGEPDDNEISIMPIFMEVR
jgi:predicted lipoprotein